MGATAKRLEQASDAGLFALNVEEEYDYIVVGSGAGGGPVAANLAKRGFAVLLLEAGGSAEPIQYRVPAFYALASENKELSWNFYVQHYASDEQRVRDTINYRNCELIDGSLRSGILYPRAGTLGGCTAHYAMILVYPHNSDWEHIAAITGDSSWKPGRMRGYFERLECCEYVDEPWSRLLNCTRHGYRGWLPTSLSDPTLLLGDAVLTRLVVAALQTCAETGVWGFKSPWHRFCSLLASFYRPGGWRKSFPHQLSSWLESFFDPNDWGRVKKSLEGPTLVPLTMRKGVRRGTRELIRETLQIVPDKLTVKLNALVTRVLLDDSNRATGVEFLDGPHLYRADPALRDNNELALIRVRARREIILACGTFNTPQLLMLSGIGPAEELKEHGITVKLNCPGVGQNLQDRYEISVVHEMKRDFDLLKDATFTEHDSEFREWREGYGLYATNGAVLAIIKKSSESHLEPDLFLFAVPGFFAGYHPGYAKSGVERKNYFTWVVLKAHTNNAAGRVSLRSCDPRDTPCIDFNYFDEDDDKCCDDLDSVVAGVEFVRRITGRSASLLVEEIPGSKVLSRADLAQFVKDGAWGHHACGTCKIGADGDKFAVLDSRFRVKGAKGLRVVDASVFPKIPGFFIVSAVYMIAEKASDAILEDA